MTFVKNRVRLAANPGATKILKALATDFPQATGFRAFENISLRLADPSTRAFNVSFEIGDDTHSVSVSDDDGWVAAYTSSRAIPAIMDTVDAYFGEYGERPRQLALDMREAMMARLEQAFASADALPLRRLVFDGASLSMLTASLDELVKRSDRPAEPGSARDIADDIRKRIPAASPGQYLGVDARGLRAPAEQVDYGVVSDATGKEVSRVWSQADAHYQRATSPARMTVILDHLETLDKLEVRFWDMVEEARTEASDREARLRALEARVETLLADPSTVSAAVAETFENWKLAPLEPTADMIQAADNAGAKAWHTGENMASAILRAGIAASPKPPTEEERNA